MFQKEFRPLEAFRKLLPDRLLDDTGTCKSDQCIGLGQDNVSQHRPAGGHASGGRFRQNRDIQQSRLAVTFQGCGSLRHLHQGDDSFLHSRTAGTCIEDQRKPFLCGTFHCAGNFLSDYFSHTRHHEASVADAEYHVHSLNLRLACQHRLRKIGLLLKRVNFLFISLELQGI